MNKVCIHFNSGATVTHTVDDKELKELMNHFEMGWPVLIEDDEETVWIKPESVSHVIVQKEKQREVENE